VEPDLPACGSEDEEDEAMLKKITSLGLIAAAVGALGIGIASGAAPKAPATLPYPLDYCIVTGEALGAMGKPVTLEYEGREIRFCCGSCVKKFKADPQKYLTLIDAAVMEAQRPFYPLATCVVDGQPLGAAPVEFLYRNTLVRVDREACRAAFVAAPEGPMAALEQAVIAKQRPTYPLATCVVTGAKLGAMGDPVDYVYQGRLVRFCCAGCISKFEADAITYLKKIPAQGAPLTPTAAPAAR
jgi:YHS domain-containing protein